MVSHSDGLITEWDLRKEEVLEKISVHGEDCRWAEYDPSLRLVASCSFDKTVSIYDLGEREQANKITAHADRVVQVRWHPFYPFLLSTSADSTARIFTPAAFYSYFIKTLD